MKKLTHAILLLSVFCSSLFSAGLKFHGTAKNSVYSFESSETHTRIYQFARFNVASADNNFKLFSTMRALTDANQSLPRDQRYKVYTMGIRWQKLFNRLALTVGRQFFHPGTVLGGLDGLNAQLTISPKVSLQLYGGVESQFQRSFKTFKSSDRRVTGGMLQFSRISSSRLQLLYLRKANEGGAYWNIAGANLTTALIPKTVLKLQSHYNIENERMHRLLLSARSSWSTKLNTTLEFKSQRPQVYANSFFTIFEIKAYNQFRAGASYELKPGYFIDGQFQLVTFENDNASRFFLNLQNKFGSLGFIYENGYAGDQLGLMFDAAYPISEKLTASVFVDYSKYRTEEVYEYDSQLANAARLSYKINRNVLVDVEYQWLTNRFKSQDSRFLNHISFIW